MSKIIKDDIKNILSDKYLSYAISTIISRSLPDVRDGLKPVHRRIIYSMYELNLKPGSPFKKSARIVGDVMGKFHPHGDQAIYDSLVRMSQDFSTRYPLIEGQGNFGNVDGDNAAAMRYTEARLDKNANTFLEGIDQNAVDFIDNYDGQNKEPSVLPTLLPNILLNGSSGIAVGMATNIPSHNIFEITKALIELIKNKNISHNKLLKIVKGPDFPTGGEVYISKENLRNIYEKGKGNFTIRSKWKLINLSKGLYNIEIYEIPYQINKVRIIENIANLVNSKKIPIDDIWDESDEKIRIIIKPKNRNIQPKKLMEVLFKNTDLSVKFYCNFNALIKGQIPKLLSLKDILFNFLDHRKSVVKRISLYRIDKIKIRKNIISGYLIAFKNLDKIIKIIRNNIDPKKELIKKFKLNSIQANAILEMRLRSLRKIEENQIKKELNSLKKELLFLNKLIKNKIELEKYLISQFEKYLSNLDNNHFKRRTNIFDDNNLESVNNSLEIFDEIENITLICTDKDNIKVYKGHIEYDAINLNDNEKIKFYIKLKSNEKLLFFTNSGKLYTLSPNVFPGGKSRGGHFSLYVNLDKFSKIIKITKFENNFKCIIVSKYAKGFVYEINQIPKIQKSGKQIFNLKKDDQIIFVLLPIKDLIALLNNSDKLLIFNTDELPVLKKSSGVLLQKIKDSSISMIKLLNKNEILKYVSKRNKEKKLDLYNWLGKRAQVGKRIPKDFKKF